MENQNELSKIQIEGQKRLSITGVSSVDGFSDQQLKLTVNGKKLFVGGNNIKITAFNKNTGLLSADGEFNLVKFETIKAPITKRIFK
ncbi:MAG: YabP/YqfC family sporulation protein [Clostridia bacterium]|nr:YabP/YqfC family sporulation protein [Clostridia bacterium]